MPYHKYKKKDNFFEQFIYANKCQCVLQVHRQITSRILYRKKNKKNRKFTKEDRTCGKYN